MTKYWFQFCQLNHHHSAEASKEMRTAVNYVEEGSCKDGQLLYMDLHGPWYCIVTPVGIIGTSRH